MGCNKVRREKLACDQCLGPSGGGELNIRRGTFIVLIFE